MILLGFNAEAFPTLADLMRRIFDETARRLISPTRKAKTGGQTSFHAAEARNQRGPG